MRIPLFIFLLLLIHTVPAQKIISDNAGFEAAYRLAVNTVDINTRRGILAAGADYGGEWTRDIAINSWNGVSFLRPVTAERSLWSVTIHKDSIGHQYWDQIIWTIAALNQYKVTGDRGFLQQAYTCSANTMNKLEQQAFDPEFGLFTGPSVFNDGIAAYPEPIYEKTNNSSFVLDHKNSLSIKCLSTNCVYYGAYRSLIEMASLLKVDNPVTRSYRAKAERLKVNILKYFYSEKDDKLYYLILNKEYKDPSQEGLGLSFAILFGILNKDQAYKVIRHATVSKYGITSIYPDFPRYSQDKPGRHNNIIWPMVSGFFAQASLVAGDPGSFTEELNNLTHLALDPDKGDYDFREIYNPVTGAPDGGWQADGNDHPDFHWASCKLQTWSATAYINMIQYGLAGIRINDYGIDFSPYLPEDTHYLELSGIVYRRSVLKIIIKGRGARIRSFSVNGVHRPDHRIDSSLKGPAVIRIELE